MCLHLTFIRSCEDGSTSRKLQNSKVCLCQELYHKIVGDFLRGKIKGDFLEYFFFMYGIQHCFICRPSDFTASKDGGIEPRTVATIRHWLSEALSTRLDLIDNTSRIGIDPIHHSARSHPLLG